ncbi:MAG: hypothetical protein AAFV43_07880 [Planctomycetota bacterium]
MAERIFQRLAGRSCVRVVALLASLALTTAATANVVIFDGFGDADINNNGVPLEEVDTDVAGSPPNGLVDTYVPARLEDAMGDGPANPEVTSVLDATDTGIRWLQTRGFTGGSASSAGAGQSKPTMRIIDDTQGAMQETMSTGLNIPAIDSGYAMSWESRGGGSSAAGFFDQRIELGPEVGDEIKVSFDFRFWRDAPNANTNIEPSRGELRFGLFQDTDNQLGQTNPFAGRQEDLNNDGFLDDVPAVWGQDEGFFEGDLTGRRGAGDDVGTNGDNGWTASVFAGDSILENGGGSRIREELQDDRILQGNDVHTIAQPENLNPDPFTDPIFDFITLDNDRVYNLSLSLVRATEVDPGDTITATLTVTDVATGVETSLTGTETLEDSTSGGIPIEGTGGVQSDSWDYFAIRNATSGASEYDFILDNFTLEQFGSNVGGDPIEGDFNNDGRVDNDDLNLLLNNWGATSQPAGWINSYTGPSVNNDELNALLNTWGQGTGTAVPEPASLLAALAAIGVASPKRRR